VTTHTTPALLQEWAARCQVDCATLAQVLRDIQARARFVPSSRDPLAAWWEVVLRNP